MKILQLIFSILLILSATAIFLTDTPVYSVLLLILTFCFSALVLFSFEVEFLGLLLILVYVGAVAVLFLFVIMMINTKKIKTKTLSTNFYVLTALSLASAYFFISFVIRSIFFNYESGVLYYYEILDLNQLSATEKIGQVLFNHCGPAVLIAGFVLLIALIGSIYLTVDFKTIEKFDKASKQASRNSNSTNSFN